MAEGRAKHWHLNLGPDYPGFQVFTFAAGTTTHKDVWRDPDKLNALTAPPPMPGDDPVPVVAGADGWVQFYGDGDYRLDIKDRDGVLLKTFDPIRITDDVATVWEGSHGTTLPAATASNKWQIFAKHDANDQFNGLSISDGSAYRNISVGIEVFNVKDYGAKGDGVTDDTVAIAAAIAAASGGVIYFPAVTTPATQYYKLSGVLAPGDNDILIGDGYTSIVRQTNTAVNVIDVSNRSRVICRGLHIWGANTYDGSGYDDGIGIRIFGGGKNNLVEDCFFTNIGLSGVVVENSTDNIIQNNTVFSVNGASADSSGIAVVCNGVADNSSRNIIRDNNVGGCGSQHGIFVQTRVDVNTQTLNDTLIEGNIMSGHDVYGIAVYRNESASPFDHTVYGTRVIGNTIKDIVGSKLSGGNKVFGAGIYIQGAEYTAVADNTITNCNQQTDFEQLAPGAIGIANCQNVVVSNNVIHDSDYAGIYWNDSLALGLVGGGIITGNIIKGCINDGIRINRADNIALSGNHVSQGGRFGLKVENSVGTNEKISVSGDQYTNNINTNISIEDTIEVSVVGCVSTDSAVHGVSINLVTDCLVQGNVFQGNTTRGIHIGTITRGLVAHNLCSGNSIGIHSGTSGVFLRDNLVTGNTTEFTGAFALIRTLDDTGTPSILGGGQFITGGVTAITAFDDGVLDQEITIISAHAVTITSGTPILLNGSVNFVMAVGDTITLVQTATNVWHEVSRMVR